MTVQELPRTDAARHSAGDADLTVMLATHDASAALTVREWRGVGRKSARKGGLAGGAETSPGSWTAQTPVKTATLGQLPRWCACSTALSGDPASRKPPLVKLAPYPVRALAHSLVRSLNPFRLINTRSPPPAIFQPARWNIRPGPAQCSTVPADQGSDRAAFTTFTRIGGFWESNMPPA